MNLLLLHQQARKLLDEHGLSDWTFKLGAYRRNLGRCHSNLKLITVSEWHATRDTEEQVMETVRHEIAHALIPDIRGHGPLWQARAIQVGCKDISKVCTDATLTRHPGTWYAICSCLRRHTWYKRPKRHLKYTCTICKQELIPVPVKESPPPPRDNLFE